MRDGAVAALAFSPRKAMLLGAIRHPFREATMFPWSVFSISAQEISITQALLVTLAGAAAVTLLLQRFRIAAVPAYLLTGALIGPHALGLIGSTESLHDVSHLAIILLLFGIGLELDLSALRHGIGRLVIAGLGSCLATTLIGWPVARAFGLTPPAALATAAALSLSSTAVVLRILSQRRELQQAKGRLSLAILVIQDLLVLVFLAVIPVLLSWAAARGEIAGHGSGPDTSHAVEVLVGRAALRLGGMLLLVAVGRWILPRLIREAVRSHAHEVLLIVGIAFALAAACASQALGFSLEIGAFLAGFLLSGTAVRHQLAGQISPLRDLFIAVFFTTVGMELDPALLVQHGPVILAGLVALLLLKIVVIGTTAWATGTAVATAISVGFALSQAGEFSLILLNSAQDSGLLMRPTGAVTMGIVALSIMLTPALIPLGERIARRTPTLRLAPWLRGSPAGSSAEPPNDRGPDHVIIGGYGVIGRRVAARLEAINCGHTIIELNPATAQLPPGPARRFLYGDVSRPEILAAAGLPGSCALILTIPDEAAVLRAIAAARAAAPAVTILARSQTRARCQELLDAGVDRAISDEEAAAELFAGAAIEQVAAHRSARS